MYWEKKVCIRITVRRIVGAILMASTLANLAIVGAAFEAAPSASTATPTSFVTSTAHLQGVAASIPASMTSESFASTLIPTASLSATPTIIPMELSTLALCVLRSDWPGYFVRHDDTLSTLARATDATLEELMLANCLPGPEIYPGQLLYLPRLPLKPPTSAPSATLTDTPAATPTSTSSATSTPTSSVTPTSTPSATQTETPTPTATEIPNTPTIFYEPYGNIVICPGATDFIFAVTPLDPEAIRSVTVVYKIDDGPWRDISLGPDGERYYGWQPLTGDYAAIKKVTYFFIAFDSREYQTNSIEYDASIEYCQDQDV